MIGYIIRNFIYSAIIAFVIWFVAYIFGQDPSYRSIFWVVLIVALVIDGISYVGTGLSAFEKLPFFIFFR